MPTIDYIVLGAYFLGITVFGALFGRFTNSTKDFFMAGQRFPAWLIAFSCVATLVGSYSFVKYSTAGFNYGIASSQTYLNDWFWMPLWMFGWLPILYFGGIVTVPEYFTRRFSQRVRIAATAVLLLYLIGYIGINLYTLGTALQGLANVPEHYVIWIAAGVAALCMAYEFTGGQTSVIFTDLLQGVLLLFAGLGLFLAGVWYVGGFEEFWELLPDTHKQSLPPFNDNPKFNFVGVFWQDGLAGGLAFYFMNQGMLLRFLSARSPSTARRAAGFVVLVLMPLTAISVAGAGWVARAMVGADMLDADTNPKHIFMSVAKLLCAPGMFGVVVAALLAALMSTADTLINASSSILVNDFYKPYVAKGREDRHYLKAAHWFSLLAATIGVCLVPIYQSQGSIYEAHALFMALVTPPMATAILLAFLWPRFNTAGALATLLGGLALMIASIVWPAMVEPFAHGVPADPDPESIPYKYTRACYGVVVSLALGIGVSLATAPPDPLRIHGLTIWTCRQRTSSIRRRRARKVPTTLDEPGDGEQLALTAAQREALAVEPGDTVFVDDARWWLGGLRSTRCEVAAATAATEALRLPAEAYERNRWQPGHPVVLSRVD